MSVEFSFAFITTAGLEIEKASNGTQTSNFKIHLLSAHEEKELPRH